MPLQTNLSVAAPCNTFGSDHEPSPGIDQIYEETEFVADIPVRRDIILTQSDHGHIRLIEFCFRPY